MNRNNGARVRILFLNRSYHPDVEATGQLLAELCADLSGKHEITVIAGRPNFVREGEAKTRLIQPEQHGDVRVLRVKNVRFAKSSLVGRGLGLVSYLVLAFWAALWVKRPDVIVVETDPPMLPALGAFLRWWHRGKLVFYLQDLFPEVGIILGKLKPGVVTWLLGWMTRIGLRNADRVVVLGEDMRRRVIDKQVEPSKISIVPNWADTTAVTPLARSPLRDAWGLGDAFVVMYSGNLGLSQSLATVLEAARRLRDDGVEFVLVGEGAAKAGLVAFAAEHDLKHVRFLPYAPKDRLGESLAVGDVHLVTLQKGLAGYIVPSKLYGILAAGRPYLAAVDADSEVAAITRVAQSGRHVEPDDAQALADAVRWAKANRDELAAMGERGREFGHMHFDRKRSAALFDEMLQGLDVAGRGSV